MEIKNDLSKGVIFPLGELVSENSKGFTGGKVWNYMFTPFESEYNCPVGNVTYSPGSRNGWHVHPGGQILLVTGGRGWYQEEGKDAKELKAGDCILVPPGVKHWHGAVKDSWFTHIGIVTNAEQGVSDGCEHISEEEYQKLLSMQRR